MSHTITTYRQGYTFDNKAEGQPSNYSITPNTAGILSRWITKLKARSHGRKILKSLNEAKEIHEGKRVGRSLDDFLKDL